MSDAGGKLVQAAIAGLLGAGVGWGANALTLAGRVEAIERGQARIETMLVQYIGQHPAQKGKPDADRP